MSKASIDEVWVGLVISVKIVSNKGTKMPVRISGYIPVLLHPNNSRSEQTILFGPWLCPSIHYNTTSTTSWADKHTSMMIQFDELLRAEQSKLA